MEEFMSLTAARRAHTAEHGFLSNTLILILKRAVPAPEHGEGLGLLTVVSYRRNRPGGLRARRQSGVPWKDLGDFPDDVAGALQHEIRGKVNLTHMGKSPFAYDKLVVAVCRKDLGMLNVDLVRSTIQLRLRRVLRDGIQLSMAIHQHYLDN